MSAAASASGADPGSDSDEVTRQEEDEEKSPSPASGFTITPPIPIVARPQNRGSSQQQQQQPSPDDGLLSSPSPSSSLSPGVPILLPAGSPKLSELASQHSCASSRSQNLSKEILKALAEGSGVRCPNCGRIGRKDSVAECSHIHCYCGINWCYHCGRSEDDVGGDFTAHNSNYTVLSDPGKCPLFLKHRYGSYFSAPDKVCVGESEQALRYFHLSRQLDLIRALRKKTNDDELWKQTLVEHFGSPADTPVDEAHKILFDKSDYEGLMEVDAAIEHFRGHWNSKGKFRTRRMAAAVSRMNELAQREMQ